MSDGGTYSNKVVVILKLLFPFTVIRWIVGIMLAVFLVAFALTELLMLDLIGIVAGVAGGHLVLIGLATIPSQMVALASSRTASFLSHPREILVVFYWLMSVLLSLAICWLWDLTQLRHYSPFMFLAAWLITSLIFQASVYLSTRWPVVHYFLFGIYLMLYDIVSWLAVYNPLYIALCLLMSWVVFARWWLKWRPAKYKVNLLFIGMVAQHKMAWGQRNNSWFNVGPAKSWLGSRLTGLPDGWIARNKRFFPRVVIAIVGFIPGYILMGDAWLKGFVHLFISSLAVLMTPVVLSNYAFNLRHIWLYTSGSRNDFFSLLQKRFWIDLVPLLLLSILITVNLDVLWGSWHGAEPWLYFLLSALLLQSLAFQVFWWVYQRTNANLIWCNVVCGGLVLWWFLMSMATGFLLKLPFAWQGISPLWIVIPEFVLMALLYKPVRLGFANVKFARAG